MSRRMSDSAYMSRVTNQDSNRSTVIGLLRNKITRLELLDLSSEEFDLKSSSLSLESLRHTVEPEQPYVCSRLQKERRGMFRSRRSRLCRMPEGTQSGNTKTSGRKKSWEHPLLCKDASGEIYMELRDKGVSEDEAAARQRRFSTLKTTVAYFEDNA